MAKNYAILIGTVGQGLNLSADGGESKKRGINFGKTIRHMRLAMRVRR